jgi:hypothetical protein
MGCGNVFKREVVLEKDVDLNFKPKKPHLKDTSDSIFFDKKKTDDIVVTRRTKNANKNKVENLENINKKKYKFHANINKKKQAYNGPIINMLKRQVDNYKKN